MKEILRQRLEGIGIKGNEAEVDLSVRYLTAVWKANLFLNLTSAAGIEELLDKHYLDSVSLIKHYRFEEGELLDMGSGAGFPGIPLKIFFPQTALFLLDSARRKINFLKYLVQEIGLKDTDCLCGRAEEYGRRQEYRERFQYVCSRAVAPMPSLLEMGLPLVRVGGVMIAYKGPKGESELQGADTLLELLGGELEKKIFYELPSGGRRTLYLFRKAGRTSSEYPHRKIKP